MVMRKRDAKDETKVNRLVFEIMKQFNFDVENLFESDPREVDYIIKDTILSLIEEEIPSVEWVRVVDDFDAEELKDEYGDFVLN